VNGVSRLHGEVSRRLFEPLFRVGRRRKSPWTRDQRGSRAELDSSEADELWTKACGKDRWLGTTETLEQDIRRVSDESLWQFATTPACR